MSGVAKRSYDRERKRRSKDKRMRGYARQSIQHIAHKVGVKRKKGK